ncbi:MAG: hypothetical protein RI897_2194 [Verrucomicrobiota bacterium]|jgi:hypothetical protein
MEGKDGGIGCAFSGLLLSDFTDGEPVEAREEECAEAAASWLGFGHPVTREDFLLYEVVEGVFGVLMGQREFSAQVSEESGAVASEDGIEGYLTFLGVWVSGCFNL